MLRALTNCAMAVGLMAAGLARADDAPPPDKSKFTLFNPTPVADLRGLCTDRPTKSTGPCTVDAGHWQVESDVYNYTRMSVGGMTTTTELFTNPTLKLGLTNTLDFEINIAPYERIATHVSSTGVMPPTPTASAISSCGPNGLSWVTKAARWDWPSRPS